mmetsp:Transcript_494/g.1360  ORF Transcript_494/g.1360 Transcript_494/m.1360 type:complete len:246 (-) Transcript_494:644-1381(-)
MAGVVRQRCALRRRRAPSPRTARGGALRAGRPRPGPVRRGERRQLDGRRAARVLRRPVREPRPRAPPRPPRRAAVLDRSAQTTRRPVPDSALEERHLRPLPSPEHARAARPEVRPQERRQPRRLGGRLRTDRPRRRRSHGLRLPAGLHLRRPAPPHPRLPRGQRNAPLARLRLPPPPRTLPLPQPPRRHHGPHPPLPPVHRRRQASLESKSTPVRHSVVFYTVSFQRASQKLLLNTSCDSSHEDV